MKNYIIFLSLFLILTGMSGASARIMTGAGVIAGKDTSLGQSYSGNQEFRGNPEERSFFGTNQIGVASPGMRVGEIGSSVRQGAPGNQLGAESPGRRAGKIGAATRQGRANGYRGGHYAPGNYRPLGNAVNY